MTFILCSPIAGLTWVMIATSHHVWAILLSRQVNAVIHDHLVSDKSYFTSSNMFRIISGFLFGLFQANGKVYNAEISHPDVRCVQKLAT